MLIYFYINIFLLKRSFKSVNERNKQISHICSPYSNQDACLLQQDMMITAYLLPFKNIIKIKKYDYTF